MIAGLPNPSTCCTIARPSRARTLPMSDLARLAAQDFRRDGALEAAFLDGYVDDPRDPALWRRMCFREAIGTASWAFQHGDDAFEQQGHRMIAEALDLTVPPIA